MKIFVVDDDPVARMIAVDQLTDPQYEVHEFADAPALLARRDDEPDLILLDIEMPGMDGLAACRAFREGGGHNAQIIFVSSHDDLDSRLAAYQAGGSDFIVKPYDAEELAEKVRAMERLLSKRNEMRAQAQYAAQTAFTAMSSMGEMGIVLQFLRASFTCRDPAELAQALFNTLQQYDLHALLEVRLRSGRQCFSSRGQFTPLEDSILGHARGMDRIFQFRDRMVINDSTVTLLALNLPMNDPERIGRLRDHLAMLIDGAEARIQAWESEARRNEQAVGMGDAVDEITRTLTEIEQKQAGNRAAAMTINSELLHQLTDAFVHLGLTDTQEANLTRMAEDAYKRLGELMDDGSSIGDRLGGVTARLRQLALR